MWSARQSPAAACALIAGQPSPARGIARWRRRAQLIATCRGVDLDTARKSGPIVIDYVKHHDREDIVDKITATL